jgi:hypothetical protein
MLMRSQRALNVKANILGESAWRVMLCKESAIYICWSSATRDVNMSGRKRLCDQMHGSARVEAKGATLCEPSEGRKDSAWGVS